MFSKHKIIYGDYKSPASIGALQVAALKNKYIQTAGFCEYGWAKDSDERKELLRRIKLKECTLKGCQSAMLFNIKLLINYSPFSEMAGGSMRHLNYLYANKTGLIIFKQKLNHNNTSADDVESRSLLEVIVSYYDNFELFNHKNIDEIVQAHKDAMDLNYLQVIDKVPRLVHGYAIKEERNTLIIWYTDPTCDIDTSENRHRIKEFIEPLSKILIIGSAPPPETRNTTTTASTSNEMIAPFVTLFEHVF